MTTKKPLIAVAVVLAIALLAVFLLRSTSTSPRFVPHGGVLAGSSVPAYDHIFFVIDENHSRTQVIGPAPYLTGLANANAQSSTFFAVTHPSVNNYMALFSGQTYSGITDGCTVTLTSCSSNAKNISDEIGTSGRTAKGYMETMPSACYLPHDSGNYTERHNPFPYFNQIRTTSRCATEDVPYTQLATDLASAATTPNFVWITPNLQNDMHNGSVAQGDVWAQANFPAIFNSPAWKTQKSLLVFTTDEDNGTSVNNIPFIAVSSDGSTKGPHYVSTVHYNFYSWLKTIESAWNLPSMTANDGAASAMTDLFTGGIGPSPTPLSSPVPSPSPVASPTPAVSPSPGATPSPSPSPSPSATPGPTGAIRAAFYYPWFPESWNQQGLNPFTHYNPWMGYYDSSTLAVERSHIAAMQYGGINAGIASWWGQGSKTDSRIPSLLSAAHGTTFKWALYYEPALVSGGVSADLAYINSHYGSDPSYLHVNGKPVVFAYSRAVASCADTATWVNNNQGDYLNLQVFGGYTGCASQPDSWHQYGPATRTDAQGKFSFSVSPGYWKANESTPKLVRDPVAFATAVRSMVASGAQWQLVSTFNEWGEGTQVEPSTQGYSLCSGWSVELDILHRNGLPGAC